MASGSAVGPGAEGEPVAGAETDPGGNAAVLGAANVIARRAHRDANIQVDVASADSGGAHGARGFNQAGHFERAPNIDLEGITRIATVAGMAQSEGTAVLLLAPIRSRSTADQRMQRIEW